MSWLARTALMLAQALLIAWAALAIHFSNLPRPSSRLIRIAFAAFGIGAVWVAPTARSLHRGPSDPKRVHLWCTERRL